LAKVVQIVDDIKKGFQRNKVWTGFKSFRVRSNGGILETWWWIFWFHKGKEFLDQMSNYELLKEDPVRWTLSTRITEQYQSKYFASNTKIRAIFK